MRQLLILPGLALLSVVLACQLSSTEAFFGSCSNNQSHNFFWGRRTHYDRLLYTNRTWRGASFMRRHQVTVELPPRGEYPRGTFTYIEVVDQFRDGSGGCAEIRHGGIGFNYIRIRLTSSWGGPLDFIIRGFGY